MFREGAMTPPGGTDPKRGESEARPATRPRVLLADDYANILTAMVRLISSSCDVVGTVTTGAQRLDACRQLKAAAPHGSVILLTAANDPTVRQGAFESGASAFVPKYRAGDELLPAIEKAFAGLLRGDGS